MFSRCSRASLQAPVRLHRREARWLVGAGDQVGALQFDLDVVPEFDQVVSLQLGPAGLLHFAQDEALAFAVC